MMFSFRPHHFLCTLGFQGRGYSPHFIKNYEKIVRTLQENEEFSIRVVSARDSICRACPHQRPEGCDKEEKIHALDERHSQVLSLKSGDILTWRMAKQRLKNHMTLESFHQACAGCSWKPLGVCEKALKELRKHDKKADT